MTPIVQIHHAGNHCRRILTFVISASLFFSALACAKRSRSFASASISSHERQNIPSPSARININTASTKELESLPGIGTGLAERIIEHRQKYGPFGRPEHLIIVRGISEHRFLSMRHQITVE